MRMLTLHPTPSAIFNEISGFSLDAWQVGNLHYTRIQAAPHAEYSGNATAILPTVSGDIIVGDTGSAIDQDINTTGIITATSFVGEGSGIYGLNISEFDLGMFGM